ncbi:hypothetical protein ACFWF7_29320, partial [Nocardia sp. NPDC060256]
MVANSAADAGDKAPVRDGELVSAAESAGAVAARPVEPASSGAPSIAGRPSESVSPNDDEIEGDSV